MRPRLLGLTCDAHCGAINIQNLGFKPDVNVDRLP